MSDSQNTCWTLVETAAEGADASRDAFARRYQPVVEAYLVARWRGTPWISEVDDAVQDLFLECYRGQGALEKADRNRAGGFRAFLFGVVRNVARRVEQRRIRSKEDPYSTHLDFEDDQDPARIFDRAWARSVMKDAASLQIRSAREGDEAAQRRIDLLRLRFQEGLPIREIASRWGVEAAHLHHEYATARKEFRASLLQVLSFYHPEDPGTAEQECRSLLGLLG